MFCGTETGPIVKFVCLQIAKGSVEATSCFVEVFALAVNSMEYNVVNELISKCLLL